MRRGLKVRRCSSFVIFAFSLAIFFYVYFYWTIAAVSMNLTAKEETGKQKQQQHFFQNTSNSNSEKDDREEGMTKDLGSLSWVNQVPRVDSHKKSRIELLYEAADDIRNLPHPPFLLGGPVSYNKTCAFFPSLSDLDFVNTYWQVISTPFGSLFLYGAYYDIRKMSLKEMSRPAVRILGMVERYLTDPVDAYCQFWFENEEKPAISLIVNQKHIWSRIWERGRYQAYLFACRIPISHRYKIPKSVSIVKRPCDNATNHLHVHYDKPFFKKDFAVCVKGLDFSHEDISVRFVEWIELVALLGANKIFFYEFTVHPNISKVLSYYKNKGFVDVTPITLPGTLPNDPRLRHIYLTNLNKRTEKRQNEMIPFNDCLYRNMYRYKYLVLMDIDELIVPTYKGSTWKELISAIEETYSEDFEASVSVAFRNVHFFDEYMKNRKRTHDIPEYAHTLQHVYRGSNRSKDIEAGMKCFHKPERIYAIHNHYPLKCDYICKYLFVDPELAQVQHYKSFQAHAHLLQEQILDPYPVLDMIMWKYKDELIKRMGSVLKQLGFISVEPPSRWKSISQMFDFF